MDPRAAGQPQLQGEMSNLLKLKLAAIASAIGLAASLGIVFAGPAGAANNKQLCV